MKINEYRSFSDPNVSFFLAGLDTRHSDASSDTGNSKSHEIKGTLSLRNSHCFYVRFPCIYDTV